MSDTVSASIAPAGLPTFDELMAPTLEALDALGGAARTDELNVEIARILALPDELLEYRRPGATMDEVAYRGAWARTYLKKFGAVENTARGVWAITASGRLLTADDIKSIPAKVRQTQAPKQPAKSAVKRTSKGPPPDPADSRPETGLDPDVIAQVEAEVAADWKTQLLNVLKAMPPAAFERLAGRILKESGFVNIKQTGKSGDGGIDGVGVLKITLISFQVLIQCKRHKETVSAGAIRDFRGAMVGRTDKGLFITTARFTAEAKREARRDGAPPIELIDGDALCDVLKSLNIGVSTKQVEVVSVHPEVFGAI